MHRLPIRLLPDPTQELDTRNPLVLTVEGLLSAAECEGLIARIEAAGPTLAPINTAQGFQMRPEIRNNTRVILDDVELAATLFERVRAHVPLRLQGEWTLCGANERLRCYRYGPGEYFAPHFDGAFIRNRDERSLLTFMVYLNECAAGGETGILDLGIEVRPKTGTALLFNHHLRHEGARVQRGVKYALRSDLMYHRDRALSG